MLLAENERKPMPEPAENIVDNSFKANESKAVATSDETESDIEEEDNVTDVNNIMNVIDDNSTVEYYAENVVEDTPQEQDDETDETVVIEIYSDALADNKIHLKYRNFNVRDYGYSTFSKYIQSIPHLVVTEDKNKEKEVRYEE